MKHDKNLVLKWVYKVMACAARADAGHSIETLQVDIQVIIKDALEQIDITKTSEPAGSRARFKGLLAIAVDTF